MKQTQDDQLNGEPPGARTSRGLAPVPENPRGELMHNGSKADSSSKSEQRALPPATRRQREGQVAEQPARSLSKRKSISNKADTTNAEALRDRCRQLCIALFFREQAPVRSVGFTSAVAGEGKTFIARLMAGIAAGDNPGPTTLLECNWDHPSFHEHFGTPTRPGLAEWLRGECSERDIRYQVDQNLFVIPAGEGRQDAVKYLRQLQRGGLRHLQIAQNELLIVDLPPILSTGYGPLAASLVESLIVVVRAGVTPNYLIKDTCEHLAELPVEGMILNQAASRIPRWIRQLL